MSLFFHRCTIICIIIKLTLVVYFLKFHEIPIFCAMYKYIMTFNQVYSELLAKLPASLINEVWIRLTSRKRSPLSEKEVSEINPIVELFFRYQKRLMRQRQTQSWPECPTL